MSGFFLGRDSMPYLAGMGMSPFVPKYADAKSPLLLFKRYQAPFDGRNTEMSARPSPS